MFVWVQAIQLNLTQGHDGDGEICDGLAENALLPRGVGVGVGVGVSIGVGDGVGGGSGPQ